MNPRNLLRMATLALALAGAHAQTPTPIYVSTAEELAAALTTAYQNSQLNPAPFTTINLTADITGTAQMVINAYVNINGGGYTLDMNSADRAFFVAGGVVTISNLTISNGLAQGGSNSQGGGGGAGLGGAILVGSGTYLAGDGTVAAYGIGGRPNVTLNNVSFSNNTAIGGSSGAIVDHIGYGGGGGMGGNGGVSGTGNGAAGGGGFGVGSDGGAATSYQGGTGGAGAFINISGSSTSGGAGGSGEWNISGGDGGPNAGGGGGGGNGNSSYGTGGGGGLGGINGHTVYVDLTDIGGAPYGTGGFGGGGGGASTNGVAGNGGFGGGGGGGLSAITPGSGGFGGGGGGSTYTTSPGGVGGFGAGSGGVSGGGGLGAGGAVFVMAGGALTINGGSFSGSAVQAGTGNANGSAYGDDLFLGGDVTFNVTGTMTLESLGGAGHTTDPNVARNASDPNAQGGLIKGGEGTLTLTGKSYYTGQTVIYSGTLALAAGALEQGSSGVIVGQNAGDNATLAFLSGSTLNLTGSTGIVLGEAAGATGTVIIGQDGQEGAFLGLGTISGGVGGGQVIFAQASAAGGPGAYPMLSNLTGNLSVVQDGPGTTILQPLVAYGSNTYTGGTLVKQGTLQVGGNALGTDGVTVNGGTLSVTGGGAISNAVTLGGGAYTVAVNEAGSYAGMADATSDFGNGRATAASVQAGTASAGTTLTTSFAATSAAANDGVRLSDVYSFSGTAGDIFVLELSMTSVAAGSYLGWLDTETNLWVNAVEGNTGNNASVAQQGYAGSFAAFQSIYGTQLSDYLGAYGTDTATGSAWAVINHNSDFAIVPEPSTWALLAGGLGLLSLYCLSRNKKTQASQANQSIQ